MTGRASFLLKPSPVFVRRRQAPLHFFPRHGICTPRKKTSSDATTTPQPPLPPLPKNVPRLVVIGSAATPMTRFYHSMRQCLSTPGSVSPPPCAKRLKLGRLCRGRGGCQTKRTSRLYVPGLCHCHCRHCCCSISLFACRHIFFSLFVFTCPLMANNPRRPRSHIALVSFGYHPSVPAFSFLRAACCVWRFCVADSHGHGPWTP